MRRLVALFLALVFAAAVPATSIACAKPETTSCCCSPSGESSPCPMVKSVPEPIHAVAPALFAAPAPIFVSESVSVDLPSLPAAGFGTRPRNAQAPPGRPAFRSAPATRGPPALLS